MNIIFFSKFSHKASFVDHQILKRNYLREITNLPTNHLRISTSKVIVGVSVNECRKKLLFQ